MQRLKAFVMWTFVGLGAVGLLFVALVAWSVSGAGYAFPDGDLPRHLAGRWDWTTASQPCGAESHVISFSPDRRTMTIARPPVGADTGWTAVYDLLEVKPSRLRGAIRGETRRTDAGAPVVWDLVMFGPDEYRWHRTDWQSWNYTPAVRRCDAKPGEGR
jgi:hypothetical protein